LIVTIAVALSARRLGRRLGMASGPPRRKRPGAFED
jgi:hypothetical protein